MNKITKILLITTSSVFLINQISLADTEIYKSEKTGTHIKEEINKKGNTQSCGNGQKAVHAQDTNDLTFDKKFTAIGGNGRSGTVSYGWDSDGGNGGDGFTTNNCTLTFNDVFTANAGNGGVGGNGYTVGYTGGNGGDAFIANNSTLIFNNRFVAAAGNGGDGGYSYGSYGNAGNDGDALKANNSTLTFNNTLTATVHKNSKALYLRSSVFTLGGDMHLLSCGCNNKIGSGTFDNSKVIFKLGPMERKYEGDINLKNGSTVTISTTYNEESKKFGSINYNKGKLDLSSGLKDKTVSINLSDSSIPKVGEVRKSAIFSNNQNINFEGVKFTTQINPDHKDLIDVKFCGKSYDLSQNIKESFADGIVINIPLESTEANKGKLKFLGAATVNKDLGAKDIPLEKVEFLANDPKKTINLKGNIHSKEMIFSEATYQLENNIFLTSSAGIQLKDPIFNIGSNTLSISGPIINNGSAEFSTLHNGENTVGHVEVERNINLKKLTLNVQYQEGVALPKAGESKKIQMFIAKDGGELKLKTDEKKINFLTAQGEPNKFIDWSLDNDTGVLTGELSKELVSNPKVVLTKVLDNKFQNKNIEALSPEVVEDLLNIIVSKGTSVTNESLERLTNSDAVAIARSPVNFAIQDVTQVINTRAEKMSQSLQNIPAPGDISGMSSGDDTNKYGAQYGAWVSTFYGRGNQKSRGSQPGFQSSYYGAVLGLDNLINDELALGVAFSYIKTDIKHKGLNTGDRTKADSYVVSGYGTYEISPEWFIQGVGSINHSNIKNKELRIEFDGEKKAKASYGFTSWGAEILTGYNYRTNNNIILTPLFGFEFNNLGKYSYTETGTKKQNLRVKSKAKNQLEVVLGSKISKAYNIDIKNRNLVVIPELHGNVRYDLINKQSNVDIKQQGSVGPVLQARTAKSSPLVYNVGGSVELKHNENWGYSIGYDARFADKYFSHQGSLKLKVNF